MTSLIVVFMGSRGFGGREAERESRSKKQKDQFRLALHCIYTCTELIFQGFLKMPLAPSFESHFLFRIRMFYFFCKMNPVIVI
jgi:hypothetical protein